MDARPPLQNSRPLQTNDVDHLIRSYGGSTLELEMERPKMKYGKRSQPFAQHLEELTRNNGSFRAEITFYRDCYQGSEKLMHEVTTITQDLLDQCIIGLLDNAAFGEIRGLVGTLYQSAENYRRLRQKALSDFVLLYKQNKFNLHIESENVV